MSLRRSLFSTFLILIAVLGAVSCGRRAGKTELSQDRLVVITPHPGPLLTEFGNAFQKYYRGKFGKELTIDWLDLGGSSDMLKFIHSEFSKKPAGIDVDLLWGGGTVPYLTLKKDQLLQTYHPPREILQRIPKEIGGIPLYDPDLNWFGTTLNSFGFICNRSLFDKKGIPLPARWSDLGNPAYAGMIGSGDPRHSGSTYTIYAIILQAYGWEGGWSHLMRMGGNVRNFTAHSSDSVRDVVSGDCLCALSIDYYAWAKLEEYGFDKLSFILPDLTVMDADSVALLKGAPHRQAAEEFVAFLLSPAGQKLWLIPHGNPEGPEKTTLAHMSLLPSLYDELKGRTTIPNPFPAKGVLSFSHDEANRLRNVVNDMIGTFIIDIKGDLNRVWQAGIRKGMPEAFIQEFAKIPVNKDQALQYASQWDDPVLRNKVINEWHTYNRWKIEKLERLAE